MRLNPFALVMACALAFAALFFASVVSGSFIDWLEKLSSQTQHLIQALLAVATAIFLALGALLRHRKASSGVDE